MLGIRGRINHVNHHLQPHSTDSPRLLNEVISECSINIWSCSGDAVVHINPQRKVVKAGGGDFKIKRIAQEIRVETSPEMPVICRNREDIQNVNVLYSAQFCLFFVVFK